MAEKRDEVDKDATAMASLRATLEKSSDEALRQLAKPLEAIEKRLRAEGKPLALWPLVAFGVLVVAVIAIAIVYGVWLKHHALHAQGGNLVPRYGAFGDALGPAAGALSALAVLAALVSVYFQREELRRTQVEMRGQAEHLKEAASAQNRLASAQEDLATAQNAANRIALDHAVKVAMAAEVEALACQAAFVGRIVGLSRGATLPDAIGAREGHTSQDRLDTAIYDRIKTTLAHTEAELQRALARRNEMKGDEG